MSHLLPEAQLDRFFYNIKIGYPTIDEEEKIINLTTGKELPTADKVMDASGVLALQEAVTDMPLPENVVKAILKLTHSTRPGSEHATDYVNNYLAQSMS